MKKFTAVLSLIFSLSFLMFSQEETAAKIYETFTWESVANAKKYQVVIQKLNNTKWEAYAVETVKSTSLEYKLEPAVYRIGVYSINAVGKKSAQANWVQFMILDENTPYLFSDYYENNEEWNTPVLFIQNSSETSEPSGKVIKPDAGMEKNTLHLKGNNIYFEDTSFLLVPIDKSGSGGKPYRTYNENRSELELEVVERHRDAGYVIVSYDSSKLKSGYYKIAARNSGGAESSYSILVLADGDLFFEPADFQYDEEYKINSIVVQNNAPFEIHAQGRGFTNDTEFTISAISKNPKYPYTSPLQLPESGLEVTDSEPVGQTDSVKVALALPANEVKPGYYRIQARNENQSRYFDILVKTDFENADTSSVTGVKSKYNKRNESLDLTIKGSGLGEQQSVTLVSDYIPEINGNRVYTTNDKITVKSSADKKLVVSIPSKDIPSGKYAVLIESEEKTIPAFIEIDSRFQTKVLPVEPEDAEQWVLKPKADEISEPSNTQIEVVENTVSGSDEEEAEINILDSNSTDKYSEGQLVEAMQNEDYELSESNDSSDISAEQLEKIQQALTQAQSQSDEQYEEEKEPYNLIVTSTFDDITETIAEAKFCRNLHMVGGMFYDGLVNSITNLNGNIDLEVFSLKHLFFTAGLYANNIYGSGFATGLELNSYLRWASKYFEYYTGLGAGCSLWSTGEFLNWGNEYSLYAAFHNGVILFDFLDFKYTIELYGLTSGNLYLRDLFSLGIRLTLIQPKHTSELVKQDLEISNEELADRKQSEWNFEKAGRLVFDEEVEEIQNFSNMNTLTEVLLSKNTTFIGENAFRSDFNLKTINIYDCQNLIEIGKNAFANDISIEKMTLPSSVRLIDESAFYNWTSGQIIVLDWTKESDEENGTLRDLAGLDATKAVVQYSDGTLYKPMENVFMNPSSWENSATEYKVIAYKETPGYKNGVKKYLNGLGIYGSAKKAYKTDLRWANVTSSEELIEEFKKNPVLNIKGSLSQFSECKKFKLIVGTGDGGYFEKSFTLSKKEVKTVKIKISKLKPSSFSKKKKYELSEIKSVLIVPDWSDGKEGDIFEAEIQDIWGSRK